MASPAPFDPALQSALLSLAIPGLLIGHRVIQPGDERALTAAEAASIPSALTERRRASGAARLVARDLLKQLGRADAAILRGPSGEPLWPEGIVGALAHDDVVAIAAVGRAREVGAIGIDVEPAEPLPSDMIDLVTADAERRLLDRDPLAGRVLFAAKEAVYKAAFPRDCTFLEFHDITVDLDAAEAVTRAGHTFALRLVRTPRIVVVAMD